VSSKTKPISPKKLWNTLFSPPCPNCKSTETIEELRDIPVVATGTEFLERMKNEWKGKPNKPVRTWKCLKCGSIFDDKGSKIIFK